MKELNYVSGNPTPTATLISRLRLMAGAGGMLTRDRLKVITEAAARLDEYMHGLYKEGGKADEKR